MDNQVEDYKAIGARAQQRVLDAIPKQWRLSSDARKDYDGNALLFISRCGILSEQQLKITELSATDLLGQIHSRQLSATAATEAFCARTAVVHQLKNCLTDFFPEEALEYAKALDDDFAKSGKLVGPLHGIPVAVKDMQVSIEHLARKLY